MENAAPLVRSADLAERSGARQPNESAVYRTARTALLTAEIDLRRQMEAVAKQRRALPPGGAVEKDYRFEGADGPTRFADLFGGKDTLMIYSLMLGPAREEPCPMCTSVLASLDGVAPDLAQRMSLVFTARSPIARLLDYKTERGWRHVRLYADTDGAFTRDYISSEDADMPGFNVFSRKDGTIRHFWGAEMGFDTADPGQDPRGGPELETLYNMLDMTPEGRGTDWYPKLSYA